MLLVFNDFFFFKQLSSLLIKRRFTENPRKWVLVARVRSVCLNNEIENHYKIKMRTLCVRHVKIEYALKKLF